MAADTQIHSMTTPVMEYNKNMGDVDLSDEESVWSTGWVESNVYMKTQDLQQRYRFSYTISVWDFFHLC